MNNRATLRAALAGITLFVTSSGALAAGPLDLCAPNTPFLWPNAGRNIPFNPDRGALGILNNTRAVRAVEDAFRAWENVPTSTATYKNAGLLPFDVNETNFFDFFFTGIADGLSPIVFDNDGAIFEFLFGPDSGILGFAGPDVYVSEACQITEGAAFLNGPVFDSREGLLDLMVHEFGHYSNLAHAVVNGQIFIGDTTGPTPDNDTFGLPPFPDGVEVIETMYPFLFLDVDQLTRTPDPDDRASLSNLYPTANYLATTGTIRGRILARGNELSGVNVIARNVADPFGDAVSAISGDYTQGAPPTGVYTLNGLTPGATYAVYTDVILAGGFSTPPRIAVPGPEEFHNTVDTETDDPLDVRRRDGCRRRAADRHRHHVQSVPRRHTATRRGRWVRRGVPAIRLPHVQPDVQVGLHQRERQRVVRRAELLVLRKRPSGSWPARRALPACGAT